MNDKHVDHCTYGDMFLLCLCFCCAAYLDVWSEFKRFVSTLLCIRSVISQQLKQQLESLCPVDICEIKPLMSYKARRSNVALMIDSPHGLALGYVAHKLRLNSNDKRYSPSNGRHKRTQLNLTNNGENRLKARSNWTKVLLAPTI